MANAQIAYLGPPGTYSHLVAQKYFGARQLVTPLPTVSDVCRAVARGTHSRGIVPIENSSGGVIYEMADILLAGRPRIHIEEEITLNVKLALIGGKGEQIKVLYSHFAPLEHCSAWLKRHLPHAERRVVASTAAAAARAARERNAAALGSRKLAGMYGLSVIRYPVQADMPNITSFLALRTRPVKTRSATRGKTIIAAWIPHRPGSLCALLEAFRSQDVNLLRIVSRPIRGCPRQYAFLLDIEGHVDAPRLKRSLSLARQESLRLRVVGSFPWGRSYNS